MRPNVVEFRNILVQFCRDWKTSTKKVFEDFHVDSVLEHAAEHPTDDLTFISTVLWKCSCTNGKFNNATVVFLAVVKFLKDRHKDIGQQPFVDLGAMLKQGTTEGAIRQWLETHYS